MVEALEAHSDDVASLQTPGGLRRLVQSGEISHLAEAAPDLAMQVLTVLAKTHHIRMGAAYFRSEERLRVEQDLAGALGQRDEEVGAPSNSSELSKVRGKEP